MSREVTFDFESVRAELLRENHFRELPRRSCVFRIFDRNDNLILLEKTYNLPSRLEQFYSETPQPGAIDLREISDRIEFCATDSPFESLYLLYLERRRWFPTSYRRMKTFPAYHLIEIDPRHRFPRIDTTRKLRTGARYFGPFRTRSAAEQAKTTAERAFRIRPCEFDIRGDDPYPDCLYFQMQTCSRPCNGDIDRDAYGNDVAAAIALIKGRDEAALAPLLKRIQTLAEETRFEEAEQLRLLIERTRKGQVESQHHIFEISRFDFAVLMNARSARSCKVALVRSGQILRIEEHSIDTLAETLETSLAAAHQLGHDSGNTDFAYDEFCLNASFILRPLRSVVFFPLDAPERTTAAITSHIQTTKEKKAKKRKRSEEANVDEVPAPTEVSRLTDGC